MAHDTAAGGRVLLPDILSWVDIRIGHNRGALEIFALRGTLAGVYISDRHECNQGPHLDLTRKRTYRLFFV